MPLISEELKAVTINELLLDKSNRKTLEIPSYQRPYKWRVTNVNQLINDIIGEAERDKDSTYRIGSIILYKDPERDNYEIVDGQQRLVTMTLILKALGEENLDLEDISVENSYTRYNLWHNYHYIKTRKKDLEGIKEYLKQNVEFVQIVIDNLSESFQFFDSANTRGRDLFPHDLLKAHHLRSMNGYGEFDKRQVTNVWEEMNQEGNGQDLSKFFADNLYKTIRWSKGKRAYFFKISDIDLFKGVSESDIYNFSKFIKRGTSGFGNYDRTFQIAQDFINGEPFFYSIQHYKRFNDEVKEKLKSEFGDLYAPQYTKQRGYKYVLTMFENAAFYFANKFSLEDLNKEVMNYLALWAFSLRLQQQNVRIESIDKFARSIPEGHFKNMKNAQIDLFRKISDAKEPRMVIITPLQTIEISEIKYQRGLKNHDSDPVIDLFKTLDFIDKGEAHA